jgi:hypothetical protein
MSKPREERTGKVSMTRDGVRYEGGYVEDGDMITVSTETGTMKKKIMGMPVKSVAEQLLAKLVQEELKSLK